MEEHEEIQLRSDEVEEILGKPPSWIVRWGTTVIFITFMMLLAISWMVEYPDIIDANIIITTPSPPMKVVTEEGGRLLELRVKQGGKVRKDDLIAIIESSAHVKDVLWLEKTAKKVRDQRSYFPTNNKLKLGEIQYAYSTFLSSYKDYSFKSKSTFSKQQIDQLGKMIQGVEKKKDIEWTKMENLQKQIGFLVNDLRTKQELLSRGMIAEQEVQNVRAEINRIEGQKENINSAMANYDVEIEQLRNQILDIQRGKVEGGYDKWIEVQESLNKLIGSIDEWKKKYLIYSPLDGEVELFEVRNELQYIAQGTELMMIIPKRGEIMGRMEMPIAGAGKVQKNQAVNIRLHEYPSKEFGILKGKITSISLMAKDDKYQVEVALPDGLVTSYNKTLSFKQQMSGMAEIKTDEKRFLLRIFDKFADIFKNK